MIKLAAVLSILAAAFAVGCSTPDSGSEVVMDTDGAQTATPPPAIQAWMDRLTVDHAYDPDTGFIVARETIGLPSLIADAPALDVAIEEAGDDRLVIAFATADRCAPCQQYKRDALNDGDVIAAPADDRFLATHVEGDRSPELADARLGSRGIPMTYALRDGEVIAQLRGQRSAADLLGWLQGLDD